MSSLLVKNVSVTAKSGNKTHDSKAGNGVNGGGGGVGGNQEIKKNQSNRTRKSKFLKNKEKV